MIAHIGDYPRIRVIEYSEIKVGNEGIATLTAAYTKMREAVAEEFANGLDEPTVSLDINFIDLSTTEQYKNYEYLQQVFLGRHNHNKTCPTWQLT